MSLQSPLADCSNLLLKMGIPASAKGIIGMTCDF